MRIKYIYMYILNMNLLMESSIKHFLMATIMCIPCLCIKVKSSGDFKLSEPHEYLISNEEKIKYSDKYLKIPNGDTFCNKRQTKEEEHSSKNAYIMIDDLVHLQKKEK